MSSAPSFIAGVALALAGCSFEVPLGAIDAAIDGRPPACVHPCPGRSCNVAIAASAWEISSDGVVWSPVTLPSTNWPCDNCRRFFRTPVCEAPAQVEYRWASDNRARMRVNDRIVLDDYWLPGYCTDAPCCNKCCDTPANCTARLSQPRMLPKVGLDSFKAGVNVLSWEVEDENGGSGFHALVTLSY